MKQQIGNITWILFSLMATGISFATDPAEDISAPINLKPSAPIVIWPDAGQKNKLAPNYTATVTVYAESEELIGDKTYTLTRGPYATATASSDEATVWTGSGTSYSITNTALDAAAASIEFECVWTAEGGEGSGGGGGEPNTKIGYASAHINLLDSSIEWNFFRTRQWAKDGKEMGFGIIATDTDGYGLERWSLTGFSPADASPAAPNWQIIPVALNPNASAWERTANVSSSTPSKGKVKVKYNDGSPEERTAVEEIAFIELKLVKVGFGGTGNKMLSSDVETKYFSSPHWNDPNGDGDSADGHSHPVAYVSATKLTISPEWELNPQVGNVSLKIRATGTNSTVIDSVDANLNGKKVDLSDPAEATVEFTEDIVRYWEDFEVDYEASFQTEQEWVEAGTSNNKLYVTKKAPAVSTLFHTVVHISCENADGLTSESEIIAAVWSHFEKKEVKSVTGTKLTYYGSYTPGTTTTLGLLRTNDGECGAWATFFMDCLKVQGITRTNNYVIFEMPLRQFGILDEGFIVKNWNFNPPGTSGHATLPFYGVPKPDFKASNKYNWIWSEVNDVMAPDEVLIGQNSPNPASYFRNHQMILIDGTYYDPSYGETYTGQADFENKALAGIFRDGHSKTVNESDISYDLNGDDDFDDSRTIDVTIFKEKGSQIETIERQEDY